MRTNEERIAALHRRAAQLEREKRIQGAMLEVRRKYGANALFKGMNLLDGAMTLERNTQIGGHKA